MALPVESAGENGEFEHHPTPLDRYGVSAGTIVHSKNPLNNSKNGQIQAFSTNCMNVYILC